MNTHLHSMQTGNIKLVFFIESFLLSEAILIIWLYRVNEIIYYLVLPASLLFDRITSCQAHRVQSAQLSVFSPFQLFLSAGQLISSSTGTGRSGTGSTRSWRKMQCTPESNIYHEGFKGQHSYNDCSDSGFSGLFHTPQSISGVDCKSLSPQKFNETSKENLRLSVTPKERTREALVFLKKDCRGNRPSTGSWSETPKREFSLRHRLLMCRPATAVKTDNTRSPCTRRTESSVDVRSAHWLSTSFESLDTVTEAYASSTLKVEQNLPLSGRKRRLLFTQGRTSTLEDGTLNAGLSSFERRISLSDTDFGASDQINIETPRLNKFLPSSSKEGSQSPIGSVSNNLYDSSSSFCTPLSTHTPRYIRYVLSQHFLNVSV